MKQVISWKFVYRVLNERGIIKKILDITGDRKGIVKGLHYAAEFFGDSSFFGMGYWAANGANVTLHFVLAEFAKIMKESFEYMQKNSSEHVAFWLRYTCQPRKLSATAYATVTGKCPGELLELATKERAVSQN